MAFSAAALIISGIILTQTAPAAAEKSSGSAEKESAAVVAAASEALQSGELNKSAEEKKDGGQGDQKNQSESENAAGKGSGGAEAEGAAVATAASEALLASELNKSAEEKKDGGQDQDGSQKTSGEASGDSAAKNSGRVRAGMLAPVERGGLLYYATVGFPQIRTGIREGMNGYDIGAEAGFDYSLTDFWVAANGRAQLLDDGKRVWTLGGQVGFFGSVGSKWLDDRNRPGQGIRLQADAGFYHHFSSPIVLAASAHLPFEIPLSSCGLFRFGLLAGVGIEFPVKNDFVISVNFDTGPMLWRPYGGVSYFKFAYDISIGVTYRLF